MINLFWNDCISYLLTFILLLEPNAPPQSVRGYAESSRSVLLQWNEVPPLDQNGVIKGYIIIYRALTTEVKNSTRVDAPKRELILVRLNEFTYYSLCVLAFTSKGDGPSTCIVVLTDSKFCDAFGCLVYNFLGLSSLKLFFSFWLCHSIPLYIISNFISVPICFFAICPDLA